jgi:hypothetical protein
MLFLIDGAGRPCQYASFVRVGGHMSLFTDRSTFSQHEVEALRSGPDPSVADAIFVVLDGFTALEVTGSSERPFPPPISFTFELDGSQVAGFAATLSSTLYENPSAPPGVAQRITLGYRITFTDAHAFDAIAPGESRAVRVTADWGPSRATGKLTLFRREHVYMIDGAVPWLSVDVQVLQLARGAAFAGTHDNNPAAFIGQAIQALRTMPDSASHPFEQLTHQTNAHLELADSVGGVPRDNFVFAKVRLRAPAAVDVADVKVFFRMFTTAATTLAYDAGTTYRRQGNGPAAVALPGIVNGEVVSQPFFAGARNPNPAAQQDPANVATLHGAGATEAVAFFGAWLDFNHDASIRNRIRGHHQCIVAEVHYPPGPPIPHGAAPADNDQLSQRNLAIVESDNPGDAAAHTLAHTFDLKQSRTPLPQTLLDQLDQPALLAVRGPRVLPPDELFIRWHELPRDSAVEIYLPDADIEQILLLAAARPGYASLTAIDAHTIGCRVSDATYLPLPGGRPADIAGLLTIQLPATVRTGTTYHVSVHQISGSTRSIIASFQLAIPVSTGPLMLPEAQRSFDVLRAIGATISVGDRWRPVFDRYLKVLGSQLVSIGGTTRPGTKGGGHPGHRRPRHPEVSGKVVEILYDCFGDLQGFVLETCGELREFYASEQRVWRLVELAAAQRAVVDIEPDCDDRHRVNAISLRFC